MGRSIRREAAKSHSCKKNLLAMHVSACQYIVTISNNTKQKRQPITQTQLNTLRTVRFNNATAPSYTKIQLPKGLYITHTSVDAQCPKPRAYAVTYLSEIADSLPPLHVYNCKSTGVDTFTKETQRKEGTSERQKER